MRILSTKTIVSLCSAVVASIFIMAQVAQAASYDPSSLYGYAYTRTDPAVFQATDGNERLRLKKLADIERASKAAIHTDSKVKADYMCDWSYDKVLGRYVCEKNYQKAFDYTHPNPIPVCPFGYVLDYGRTNCVKIRVPISAHLNARGDGWECNPGYHANATGTICLGPQHVSQQCPGGSFSCSGCQGSSCAQPCFVRPIVLAALPVAPKPLPTPIDLPSTGPSIGLLLVLSALGAKRFLRKK